MRISDWSSDLCSSDLFANVEGVEAGDTAFAIANGPAIADAAAGREPFDAPVEHVCTVARLYGQELHVAARAAAGPTKVADLRGSAVATHPRGSPGARLAVDLLAAAEVEAESLEEQIGRAHV